MTAPKAKGFKFDVNFPDPDPELENWKPDPDTVPKAGGCGDFRFDRDEHHKARLSTVAHDTPREMQRLGLALDLGAEPSVSTQVNGGFGITGQTGTRQLTSGNSRTAFSVAAEQAQVGSTDGITRASDSSSKIYDINVNTAVDLSKGWPAPEVRAYGPPRSTELRRFTHLRHGSDTKTLADQLQTVSLGDDNPTSYGWNRTVHIQEILRWEENMEYKYRVNESDLEAMTTGGLKRYYDQVRHLYRQYAEGEDSEYFLRLDKKSQADVATESLDGYGLNVHKAPVVADEDGDARLARDLEIAEVLGCDVNNVETALWDQHRLLNNHVMEHHRMAADQYTRKLRIDNIITWEMALGIDIQQRAVERDLMAMATDEFERYFSKIQEAYQMWAAAEEFEHFKMKDRNTFRDRPQNEFSGDRYDTHDLNVACDDSFEDSDADGKLDFGESDKNDGDDEGHAQKDDSYNGL